MFNQGHESMVAQSRRHYKLPADTGEVANFAYYTWLTQIQQGRCLKTSFEKGRRHMSTPSVRNMGSIVWQINTNWQAPSWATMDYSGNWKVSMNMLQQTFSDLLVSAYFDEATGSFYATIVSELTQDIDGAFVEISEHRLDSKHAQGESVVQVAVDKIPAKAAIDLAPYHKASYCGDTDNCMVRFSVKGSSGQVLA